MCDLNDTDTSLIITLQDGDEPLAELLSEWGYLHLYPKLNDAGVDISSLMHITEDDLDKLFPEFKELGTKINFRAKIVDWRKSNGIKEYASTISVTSSFNPYIVDWLQSTHTRSIDSPTPSTSSSVPNADATCSSTKVIDNMFEIPHIKELLNSLKQNASNPTRDLLCKKITAHLLEEKAAYLNTMDFQKIVDKIVKHCPLEKPDFYFQDGKIKKGKLYYKYRNHKTNLRQVGLLTKKFESKRAKLCYETDEPADENLDEAVETSKEWLKYHTEPWQSVEQNWKITAATRMNFFRNSTNKTAKEFIKEWPLLKCPQAYHLVDIDFDQLYPEKNMIFFKKWTNEFSMKLYNHLIPQVKDKLVQDAGRKISDIILSENFQKGELNLDHNNFVIAELFRQLNGVLTPTTRKKSLKNNIIWKPSIVESFDSFIQYISEVSSIKKILDAKQIKYAEYGLAVQPSLFAEIESNEEEISKITKIYLYFDDIFYVFDNIINAIDINFKLFFVMNLKYPFECFKIYKFLEYVIYNMPDKTGIPIEIQNLKEFLD